MDKKIGLAIIDAQKSEITEYYIYNKLADVCRDSHNKEILRHIAEDEKMHHDFWKKHTKVDVRPKKILIWFYFWLARIFGLTFGLKIMEKGEDLAQQNYKMNPPRPKGRGIHLGKST